MGKQKKMKKWENRKKMKKEKTQKKKWGGGNWRNPFSI